MVVKYLMLLTITRKFSCFCDMCLWNFPCYIFLPMLESITKINANMSSKSEKYIVVKNQINLFDFWVVLFLNMLNNKINTYLDNLNLIYSGLEQIQYGRWVWVRTMFSTPSILSSWCEVKHNYYDITRNSGLMHNTLTLYFVTDICVLE